MGVKPDVELKSPELLRGEPIGPAGKRRKNEAAAPQGEPGGQQADAATREVEGVSGGGRVRIRATGTGQVLSVSIAPEVVDPDDVPMLEDLVLAALHPVARRQRPDQADELGLGLGRGGHRDHHAHHHAGLNRQHFAVGGRRGDYEHHARFRDREDP